MARFTLYFPFAGCGEGRRYGPQDTAAGRRQVFRFLQVCSCRGMPRRTRGSVRWNEWRRLCRGAPQYAKKGREREAHNWQSTGNLPPERRKTSRKFPKNRIFFARRAPETDFFHNFRAGKVRLMANDGQVVRGGKGDRKGRVGERKGRRGEERCGFQKKCKKVLTPRGWFGIINERSRERRTLTSK